MAPVLTIDNLKSYGVDPHYFGLGFIQLKINDHERLHFYHDDLPILAEEPHDHRYNFISEVLQGTFEQTIWGWMNDEMGGWELCWEDCNPNKTNKLPPKPRQTGFAYEMTTGVYPAGSKYRIMQSTLHTVSASDNCITFLTRESPLKDFAAVARKIGTEAVCPFSQPIEVGRCWEMIEDMLPEIDAIENPGYHLTKIPKGVVGEPSKIIEEAMEIADAHAQGVNVMTLVEMSDLYGALDRYREKYHPGTSIADLEAMYRVTRRAFESGKRA